MPSLLELDSPPQIPAAGAGAWGSLYAVEEPVKPPPRHVMVVPAANKKPAPAYGYYGGGCGGRKKKNLDTCTEPLGCETGAVDAAPPAADLELEVEAAAECAAAERTKRRAREEEKVEVEAGRAVRRPLPPPLTTLAAARGGGGRVRMVHERRDGRLAMYAVRAPGVEAERSGGRLRMRLVSSLPTSGSSVACRRQEAQQAELAKEEEECGVAEYVRGGGGRCVEPDAAAAGEARQAQVGAGAGCRVLGRHLLNTTNGLVAPTAY